MWIRHIFFVALLSMSALCEDDTEEVAKFQKLFMQKRIEQLSAVKNILKLDESKRKVLLDQITSKLFQVINLINILLFLLITFISPFRRNSINSFRKKPFNLYTEHGLNQTGKQITLTRLTYP